ncbi:RNA-binding S4 domain-containing protein [Roseovarius sp. LXJ103]|uniref:RNA-binding S4 domain-containing protein n=1 Tax=Roseovarius carneus TaxID=2853164 RepID=UPI000D619801|nr:RNA-binding S4 domain-containing protein [Roseovarius carneus]MBZ8118915.1 RNA-binding S4 domain-containing protein [Roseovarius carneus]PWE35429.1 RNA-binding protein S4 [Pelagicola sp. LXJ1103]
MNGDTTRDATRDTTEGGAEKLRIDKWLWQARFFKTRALAAKVVSGGHVRVNSTRISKPASTVRAGDVLTFAQARIIRVIRVEAIGTRRGPAPEAQTLYTDLSPPPDPATPRDPVPHTPKFEGKGRPTGRDRRKLDLNHRASLD